MSHQITEAHVQQFNSNVFHLSQQKGSRLQPAVRNVTQKGKSEFFDSIGQVAATKRVGRHASTPQVDTPHGRRRVTLNDYEHADLVDAQDKIRILMDPTSEYALAFSWAFGRSKDDEIIEAAFDTAYTGEEGTVAVAHPNSQKYAANDGTAFTNLNVKTLRKIKAMFWQKEVDASIPLFIACAASQLEAMLGQTEVTSSDYNTVKALAQGEIDTFMGFKFIHTERLAATTVSASPTTGSVGSGSALTGRRVIAWAKDGLILSTGEDYLSKVSERNDKGHATQIYSRMSVGSTRMEEEKVVEVICKES